MSEPNYEALGRYMHLRDEVTALAAKRSGLLARIGVVLKNANEPSGENRPPRKLNFEAVQGLLAEAEQLDQQIRAAVDQVNELAPLADKPPYS